MQTHKRITQTTKHGALAYFIYLHRHYKCFGTSWKCTWSSSNCSVTSATLTGTAVAVTVSTVPNIKLHLYA